MNLNVLLRGQSNAYLLGLFNGNELTTRVDQLLGFDGVHDTVTLEYQQGNDTANTVYSGTSFLTQWLTPTATGGWQVSDLEQGLLNYINGLSAAQKAQPTAVVWLHSEYDSGFGDLTPAYWESAVRYDAALIRAAFGQTAAQLPYMFVSAIPYNWGTDTGHQAIRQGMEELAADPSFDATIAARIQDADMTWDSPTVYGGSHLSFEDQRIAAIRIAASVAQEFAAYAKPGSPVALAGGNIDNLGPQVVQASVWAPDQLLLKVKFDAASSLAPLDATAALGEGWTIIKADGTELHGTAAAVAPGNPDMIFVSFSGPIPTTGTLYYGYGYGRITAADGSGEGHAVYDNVGLPIWVDAHGLHMGTSVSIYPGSPEASQPVHVVPPSGNVLVGAAGGSFAGTAAADTWEFSPTSGTTFITGFTHGVDHLQFDNIAASSLMTWNTSHNGTAGLGVAWNSGAGAVFLAGVSALQAGDALFATAAAAAPPAASGGSATTVDAAGGSYAGTEGADTWSFNAQSGTTRISGFTPGVDHLDFTGVDPSSITTWHTQRDGVAGLGVAWNGGDGYAFLDGISQLGAGDLQFSGTAAPPAAAAATIIGPSGGTYAATGAAENWVISAGSGHSVIQGFDPAVDTLTFTGITPGSLVTWHTSSIAGLGIAWNTADGDVILPGVSAVPDSHILFA